jgi:branched-chain amino acid transport system permease protein
VTDRLNAPVPGQIAGSAGEGQSKLILALVVACSLLALLVVPQYLNSYWLRVLAQVVMIAALASSWNVIAGICGYFSFGNVVFFGIGAYTTAVLMSQFGVPFLITIPLGGILAAIFAALTGLPLLRLRGHYFAIATLGINLGMRETVTNLDWTGGGKGIWLQIPDMDPHTFSLYVFYMMSVMLAITIAGVTVLLRSRAGYAMRAIRGNETSAAVLGIDTTFYKVLAFAISALFSGMVGSIYIFWMGYIEPSQAFDMGLNIQFVMAGLMGGLGSVIGPLLGAAALQLFSELIWSHFLEVHLAVLGLLIVLVVLFLPNGLVSLVSSRRK